MTRDIKVYDPKRLDLSSHLKLITNFKGDGVMLIAVDSEGENLTNGTILEVNPKGITLCSGVGDDLGFRVTYGKIHQWS